MTVYNDDSLLSCGVIIQEDDMLRLIPVIFLFLHGTVHLLYAGHSKRLFELSAGLDWPDGSRLHETLGSDINRLLAVVLLILADFSFTISAVLLLLETTWWRPALISAAILSSLIFILFWDGEAERLPDQGAVGILINMGLIAGAFLLWHY